MKGNTALLPSLCLCWILLSTITLYSSIQVCDATWLSEALGCQRAFARNIPFNYINGAQTHNSFNARRSGFKLAENQVLTLTQQLDLGVRGIELDVHNISALNPPVRVCHGSADTETACQNAGFQICQFVGIQDYGASTGCMSTAPTWSQTLAEIATWIKNANNSNEFISISLELEGSFDDNFINNAISTALDPYVFTPNDLLNFGTYPSLEDLISLNKRVYIAASYNFTGTYVHIDRQWPGYPHKKVRFFQPYPDCSSSNPGAPVGTIPLPFGLFYGDESTLLGLTDGPSSVGVISPTNAPQLMNCGFSPAFDMINSPKMKSTIWSWDVSRPTLNTSLNCAAMGPNGRWIDEDCNQGFRIACKSNTNNWDWRVSNNGGVWGVPSCPPGYSFAAPQLALENQMLKVAKQQAGVSFIWLRATDAAVEGTWQINNLSPGQLTCVSTGAVDIDYDELAPTATTGPTQEGEENNNDGGSSGFNLAWGLVVIFSVLILIVAACIIYVMITMFRR